MAGGLYQYLTRSAFDHVGVDLESGVLGTYPLDDRIEHGLGVSRRIEVAGQWDHIAPAHRVLPRADQLEPSAGAVGLGGGPIDCGDGRIGAVESDHDGVGCYVVVHGHVVLQTASS